MCDVLLVRDAEEDGGGGVEGAAVVGDDVRAGEEGGDGLVVHGPAGCGEDHLVGGGADVVVQEELFLLGEDDAADAVDDAFGLARCAGGVGD